MPPQNYLFWVNSKPAVSEELWKEFYTTEHLPDVVHSGCATRALFYEEVPTPSNANPNHPRKFLAIYQTPHAEMLKAEDHVKIRDTSEMFAKEGSDTNLIMKVGDFNSRSYELIQEYDPFGTGETPPPQIMTVELHPKDVDDFERWYREEHLHMLSKIPGYRRTLRYKLGPDTGVTEGFQPDYLAIHEVDDLSGFGGKEAGAAITTPWSSKQLGDSRVVVVRGWKLILALGY